MHSIEALMERIDDYFLKKPYESNEEEINLYDLYSLLVNSYKKMMSNLYDNDNLEDALNRSRTKKEKYLGGVHYLVEYCKWTSSPSINIKYYSVSNIFIQASANISRNSEGIKICYKKNKCFDDTSLKNNFDLINQKFDILEKYSCIFNSNQVFSFSDELYKAHIALKDGEPDVAISLKDHIDDTVFRKNISDELIYYTSDFYNRHVLQRMHTRIDKLPEDFQTLIYNCRKIEKSKEKVKTIRSN